MKKHVICTDDGLFMVEASGLIVDAERNSITIFDSDNNMVGFFKNIHWCIESEKDVQFEIKLKKPIKNILNYWNTENGK